MLKRIILLFPVQSRSIVLNRAFVLVSDPTESIKVSHVLHYQMIYRRDSRQLKDAKSQQGVGGPKLKVFP